MQYIGHGTDLVEVERIREILRRHGHRFLQRLYTPGERVMAGDTPSVRFLAGRFAAKEAILKALGTGWIQGLSWTDIDVGRLPSGKPMVVLSGGCRQVAHELGIVRLEVSITHTSEHAAATAIAIGIGDKHNLRGE
jgi:holo-[acyl-carrier protein] synthase